MAELALRKRLSDDRFDVGELAKIVSFIKKNSQNIDTEPFNELLESLGKIINKIAKLELDEVKLF